MLFWHMIPRQSPPHLCGQDGIVYRPGRLDNGDAGVELSVGWRFLRVPRDNGIEKKGAQSLLITADIYDAGNDIDDESLRSSMLEVE